MTVKLDHIIFGCADLALGVAELSEALGAPPGGFGRHDMMGTHNALWRLGEVYLELIAIDPQAEPPGRARWFGLDEHVTRSKLATGPRLLTWAVSADPLEPVVSAAPVALGPIEAFRRGDFSWRVAVPVTGAPGLEGAFPLTISWTSEAHPALTLPDAGLSLGELVVNHPHIVRARQALGAVVGAVNFGDGPSCLRCKIVAGGKTLDFQS